ncbi:hypothetical protein [Paraburkholderia rhizosphaerae]|uniref:Uncharacterized protein n=1 Tax=Paraburkholderia rhizosphaerae TaxID=480658 RepID=A0A4R8LRT2_9BURK|nr:hypothetical protein [Paraburkholderia rhizosphaerae]TDY49802.1 hypothetical protein BX592_11053 [Paraburkholderia rhizosphaerae]
MKRITFMLGIVMMLSVQPASADAMSSSGKGYAGVEVRVAPSVRGAPGAPIDVQVDYIASPSSGAVEVSYTTEDSLMLKSPARKQLVPDSNGFVHDTVVVQANSIGAYFLNVFVKTSRGSDALSIPVTIGSPAQKPRAASSVLTPGGQRVIEMPARETVR